jgi:hypothetical protein
MSKKSNTFEDWLDVKVVLNTTKGIPNEVFEENNVSIDDFDTEEIKKIQEKQKSVFNDLLEKEYNKIESEFFSKFKNSQVSKFLIKREVESLKALIGNRFICKDGVCRSPIKGDNKTFLDWYYRSMMNHKNNSTISGIGRCYDEIPSPNSRFYDNGRIPPEVMISAVFKMLNLTTKLNLKPQRRSQLNENINNHKKGKEVIDTEITNPTNQDNNEKGNNYSETETAITTNENKDDWNRFFIDKDAYDLFLECKNKIQSRGRITKNMDTPSDLTKYSNIFHFFQDKNLIHEGTKHNSFIKYLIRIHNAVFPSSAKKIPVKYSETDRDRITDLFDIKYPKKKT